MSAAKRSRSNARQFQESLTAEVFWFVGRNDRVVCTLCSENVACRTSSTKRHFETKHEKFLEMIRRRMRLVAVSRFEKQSSILKVVRIQGRYYVRRGRGANIYLWPLFFNNIFLPQSGTALFRATSSHHPPSRYKVHLFFSMLDLSQPNTPPPPPPPPPNSYTPKELNFCGT